MNAETLLAWHFTDTNKRLNPREYMTRETYHRLRRERWRAEQRARFNDSALADSPSWVQMQLDRDAQDAAYAIPRPTFNQAWDTYFAQTRNRRLGVLGIVRDLRSMRQCGVPRVLKSEVESALYPIAVPACRLPADRAPSALQVAA